MSKKIIDKKSPSKPELGNGERFKQLSAKLDQQGADNPDALAAWIGRNKYGKDRYQEMAAKGKKK